MESTAVQRLSHHGKGGELFIIFIINVLLKIVTLGIYHFWAKTRVRRYLWSQTSFEDERFEYTGTGGELFKGFLIVIGLFIVIVIGLQLLATVLSMLHPALAAIPVIALVLLYIMLIPFGLYTAQRYMLSRTRWRSIRFGMSGKPMSYALKFLGYTLLNLLTAGLLTPFVRNQLYTYVITNTWFGTANFDYDGKPGDLYPSFLIALLLALPTLGISLLWYFVKEFRYRTEHTSLHSMSFNATFTTGGIIWLMLSNFLLIVVTVGLAFPWVLVRNTRYIASHLYPEGQLDYASIAQSEQNMPGSGEGLVEAFDMGGI